LIPVFFIPKIPRKALFYEIKKELTGELQLVIFGGEGCEKRKTQPYSYEKNLTDIAFGLSTSAIINIPFICEYSVFCFGKVGERIFYLFIFFRKYPLFFVFF